MLTKKLPYNLEILTWDSDHNRNIENKYCYCGKDINDDQPVIRCEKCQQWFHRDCIDCMIKPLLYGDTFGIFHCSVCNQGPETFERKGLSWIAIVHLVIYNLIKKAQVEDSKKAEKDRRDHYYFRWKEDVCAMIDDYWDYVMPDKQRSATWNNTIASVLSTHNKLFLSGFEKFHQSAWWTLHKLEPPTNEKKSTKSATKLKPNLKKPLKRSKMDSSSDTAATQKKPKRVKMEKKNEPDSDLLDLSSLSELSSGDEGELSNDDELPAIKSIKKKKEDTTKKKQAASKKQLKSTPEQPAPKAASTSATVVQSTKIQKERVVASPKPEVPRRPIPKSQVPTPLPPPPPPKKLNDISREPSAKQETPPPSNTEALKEESPLNIPTSTSASATTPVKTNTTTQSASTTIPTTIYSQHLSPQDEWSLLQRLEHSSKKLPFSATRYKRKLAVRRLKRNLGIKLFDMDTQIIQLLRTPKHALEPISKETTIQPASNQHKEQNQYDRQHILDKITFTPYNSSFASRLFGSIRQRETITRDEPWLSSWNGRKLRPFIRRDYQSKPKRMLLMGQIKACQGKPFKRGSEDLDGIIPGESIDYVYFQKEHLVQVNQLLSRSFWEGIDVSESLLFPEFSIVALYKRHVIGCAFMTPEAYITYFAVDAGWGNASIGQFMLYHLFQTAISKDITLHVSANNNAMILYQKFGFKPEEFIVNFYDKYLTADSVYSKNAFFLRLRR